MYFKYQSKSTHCVVLVYLRCILLLCVFKVELILQRLTVNITEQKHPTEELTSMDHCCSQVDKQEWRQIQFFLILEVQQSSLSSPPVGSEQNLMWLQVFIPPDGPDLHLPLTSTTSVY